MNKREKTLIWGLLVSIGLNLFLLGFMVARAAKHTPPRPNAVGFDGAEGQRSKVPKAVRESLKRRQAELRPSQTSLREARREVRDALNTEPLDTARLEKALAQLRESSATLQVESHRVLLDAAQHLNPEQRRGLLGRHFEGDSRRRRKPVP